MFKDYSFNIPIKHYQDYINDPHLRNLKNYIEGKNYSHPKKNYSERGIFLEKVFAILDDMIYNNGIIYEDICGYIDSSTIIWLIEHNFIKYEIKKYSINFNNVLFRTISNGSYIENIDGSLNVYFDAIYLSVVNNDMIYDKQPCTIERFILPKSYAINSYNDKTIHSEIKYNRIASYINSDLNVTVNQEHNDNRGVAFRSKDVFNNKNMFKYFVYVSLENNMGIYAPESIYSYGVINISEKPIYKETNTHFVDNYYKSNETKMLSFLDNKTTMIDKIQYSIFTLGNEIYIKEISKILIDNIVTEKGYFVHEKYGRIIVIPHNFSWEYMNPYIELEYSIMFLDKYVYISNTKWVNYYYKEMIDRTRFRKNFKSAKEFIFNIRYNNDFLDDLISVSLYNVEGTINAID